MNTTNLSSNGCTTEVAVIFLQLRNRWEKETCFISNTTQLVLHEAYQQIIGMGPAVVPLLANKGS